MFSFLFSLVFSVKERFSLVPNFEFTDIAEIGNWSLIGSATNMKKYIQLTSSVANDFGGLCQRSPTVFDDFMITNSWSIGEIGGKGLFFYFTEDVCPLRSNFFTGFSYWVDTSKIDEEGFVSIKFLNVGKENFDIVKESNFTVIGKVSIIKNNGEFITTVQKKGEKLSFGINSGEEIETFKIIHQTTIPNLIKKGYISYMAENGKESWSDVSVNVINVFPGSEVKEINDDKLMETNKKIITSKYYERKLRKSRRASSMPQCQYYTTQMKYTPNIDGKNVMFINVVDMLDELYSRMKSVITANALEEFINTKLKDPLEKAKESITNTESKLANAKEAMDDLWLSLKSKLEGMRSETFMQMDEIKREMNDAMKDISLGRCGLESALGLEEGRNEQIIELLRLIMICELIVYIVVFSILHYTTKGFTTKRD